jgi:hypothetical protein
MVIASKHMPHSLSVLRSIFVLKVVCFSTDFYVHCLIIKVKPLTYFMSILFGSELKIEYDCEYDDVAAGTMDEAEIRNYSGIMVVKDAYAFVRTQRHFQRIVQHGHVSLLFLAASPLVGNWSELVDLTNWLRLNDRLPPLEQVDGSYVRFADPVTLRVFPTMFEPGNRLIDYPTHRINDSPDLLHRVSLDVYPIQCTPHQIQSYRRAVGDEKLRVLTMSYPRHSTITQCVYYSAGQFHYIGEKCFSQLSKYSAKLDRVVQRVVQSTGTVMVHSASNEGILPAILAFEEAGFRRFGHSTPLLNESTEGNGLTYAVVSEDPRFSSQGVELVKVIFVAGSTKRWFKNIRQVHVLDPFPIDQIAVTCADSPLVERNTQLFLYVSLIDLDEEAVDLFMYRQAESASAAVTKLFKKGKGPSSPQILSNGMKVECAPPLWTVQVELAQLFKEKAVFTRSELMNRGLSSEALATLVRKKDYVVDRFGTCGPVTRVDDYYIFYPIYEPDPMEEEYLIARGFLKAPRRTWGSMAAAVLQGINEEEQDRVVVAHLAESRGFEACEKLLRRVLAGRTSKFEMLAMAYFEKHCKFGDLYMVGPSLLEVGPILMKRMAEKAEIVGSLGPKGLTLWQNDRILKNMELPALRKLTSADLPGDKEMVACELELRLRLLDRPTQRYFLTLLEAQTLL